MLKSQMWQNSQFEEFLQVDSYCTYDVFYTQYKSQETFCKWWLLQCIQIKYQKVKYQHLEIVLYTLDLLCIVVFIVLTPLLIEMGYLQKGGEYCFLFIIYGFCSNKVLYSASLSFTIFIWPAVVALQVLQIRVSPSFPLGVFLELDHQFFLNVGMVLETQMTLRVTEPDFFRRNSAQNTGEIGQNWAKNSLQILLNLCYNERLYYLLCFCT